MAHSRKTGLVVAGGVVGLASVVGIAYAVGAARYQPLSRPGTRLGDRDLSQLTQEGVRFQLSEWAKTRSSRSLNLEPPRGVPKPEPVSPADAGLAVDLEATLGQVRYDDFPRHLARVVGLEHHEGAELRPVALVDKAKVKELAEKLDDAMPEPGPAKARLVADQVERTYEMGRASVEPEPLSQELERAYLADGNGKLPVTMGAKKVPDAELDKVRTVIGRFATNFNSPPSRTNNIRVASLALDGQVIMPGQTFSFNKFLGKRTKDKGFQTAGVFKNGKHDKETGGGICQVSTTLYNAVLRADLEVVTRQPHSMPVWYVPAGQDATVSYPDLDFAFRNNRAEPVAISTFFKPGRLEFVLLGAEKKPGEVTIVNKTLRTWGVPKTITQYNPNLRPGTTRVLAKGSSGREVASWKVVKLNGQETRTSLGISHYHGGVKVVEVGPKAAPKPVAPVELLGG